MTATRLNDAGRVSTRPASRPTSRTIFRSAYRTVSRPMSRTIFRATYRVASRPVARTAYRLASRPTSRAISRTAYRAISRRTLRALSRTAYRAAYRAAYRTVGRVVTRQTTRRPRTPQNQAPAAGQSAGRALARHVGGTPLSGWKPDLQNSRKPDLQNSRKPDLQNSRKPDGQNARTPPHRTLRLVTILLLAITVTACGWTLRGSYNLPPEITPIAVEGDGVANELRDSLRSSKALAESAEDSAAADLEILKQGDSRRVISVDANGKVDEYEVRYEVRWQLTAKGSDDKSRRILVAPTTYRANRSYDYSANTVLTTNEQEQRLIDDMRDDIAQRILFRLQGVQIADNG